MSGREKYCSIQRSASQMLNGNISAGKMEFNKSNDPNKYALCFG